MASVLAELIVMGGAVLTHGNVTEVATANLYNDPELQPCVSIRRSSRPGRYGHVPEGGDSKAHLERFSTC